MRDIVLGPIIVALAVYALAHPWVGIMGWTWLSIMNPHALAWKINSMPVAALMAACTFVGMLVTKDRRQFFMTREIMVLLLFMLWMTITLPFSFSVDGSFPMWNRVMKIDLMILVAMVVLHSKKHLIILAWVLVGSLGFYGVKGGLFTLATGGSYRVWGPTGTYIEGNNEVALALIMIIPLMRFLHLTSTSVWVKRGLLASMPLCAVAALGSHSRGAFLAIGAMGLVLWWRGSNKFTGAVMLMVISVAALSFMPDEWWERMSSIRDTSQDDSANGRINAWWMAFNLAKDKFFGGGFHIYTLDIFARYAPNPTDLHAAHSIYFMVLGEHGFIGLFLFLLLWALVWFSAGRLRIDGKKLPQTMWLSHLGAMTQVMLAGYAVGGAFLSLSYYDLPYNFIVLVVVGRRWMAGKEWIREEQAEAARQAAIEAKKSKLAHR